MFPRQRLIPLANQQNINLDTKTRIAHILTLGGSVLASGDLERREPVFAIFMAGFAASNPDEKIQAIDLLKGFEGHGIGQNTSVVRQLLVACCEEQSQRVARGGRMEEVEWLVVGRERGLTVVNCGL